MQSPREPQPLDGAEPFTRATAPIGHTVLDFWRWSASDLVGNTVRGLVAEFLVSLALGASMRTPRREWDAYDVTTPAGVKVEVKSCSYVQTWTQKRPSRISFGIGQTRSWDNTTGTYGADLRRHADVYVFAILGTPGASTVDALNVDSWAFLVLPTRVLDSRAGGQKTIGLLSLRALEPIETDFSGLAAAVERAHSI